MRRLFSSAVVALSASLFVACGSDGGPTAPTQASLAGTWTLQTVNGIVLPFTVRATNPKAEVLDDRIIILPDGTFTESYNIRVTNGTTVTTQPGNTGGTVLLNGPGVVIRYTDGTSGSGSVSGNNLSFTVATFAQVFTKQ